MSLTSMEIERGKQRIMDNNETVEIGPKKQRVGRCV